MKAEMGLVKDYRGAGVEAVVITLRPETMVEETILRQVSSNNPPEGNVIGYIDSTRILIETGQR